MNQGSRKPSLPPPSGFWARARQALTGSAGLKPDPSPVRVKPRPETAFED
jgi:hypothetical protein